MRREGIWSSGRQKQPGAAAAAGRASQRTRQHIGAGGNAGAPADPTGSTCERGEAGGAAAAAAARCRKRRVMAREGAAPRTRGWRHTPPSTAQAPKPEG